MRQHVQDDAAALLLPVVPAGAVGRDGLAVKDPVAELAADGEDAAEEAGLDGAAQLDHAGEEELVLHHAVLHAGILAQRGQLLRVGGGVGDRLLSG